MELDELKQKWMELSEQVEKNELLNRQIIIDMIQSKKETYLQQQLRVEKIGFGVLGIFLGVVCYTFWRNVAPDWISWYLLGMVIWLLVMQSLMFRIVYTLKTVTEHVEQQYRRLQSYKVLMNLTYIFAYVAITPVIIAFFCIWHNPLFRTILCVMILAGFLGDYFIYHKTGDRLKGFREAVRSLQNLKSGGKE
ncbi:hypothetical protein K0F10_08255 [Bacteroides fragilis]|mgnify:FL=1|uniref:hypothetical protein n=1 Tax=Bacteroides TaxID=816 RepID=UPI00189C1F5A|nr:MULTISPECIES: hypothetical protein [Bacteroides]MBW9277599.1 hypothetical protein [Bacteroides fragilis]MCE8624067.1 hypothetical protein [Bacteroides fragilis]MCE8698589.1 hypothetical protein [Bacteroides fragilis]MCE8704437.1 hypothetical protein [Bacteroides fragilis]MCE9327818.1 hypothetical protein [Bacteroides fragilis]